MSKRILTPFHQMPGEVLAHAVRGKSLEVAGKDTSQTSIPRVGYLLRAYAGLLYGGSPLSKYASIDGSDPLLRLPSQSLDALTRVAISCIKVVVASSDADHEPILPNGFPHEINDDGEAYFTTRDVLPSVQVALEGVDEPHPDLREMMLDNELRILMGDLDPLKTRVLRMRGASSVTRESARDLALVAGEEFGNFFGGLEFLFDDEKPEVRDSIVNYVGTIVGSQWQHPEWQEPTISWV